MIQDEKTTELILDELFNEVQKGYNNLTQAEQAEEMVAKKAYGECDNCGCIGNRFYYMNFDKWLCMGCVQCINGKIFGGNNA